MVRPQLSIPPPEDLSLEPQVLIVLSGDDNGYARNTIKQRIQYCACCLFDRRRLTQWRRQDVDVQKNMQRRDLMTDSITHSTRGIPQAITAVAQHVPLKGKMQRLADIARGQGQAIDKVLTVGELFPIPANDITDFFHGVIG
ncbi:hypothetical protein D3C84_367990 [compost metagenome]